MAGNMFAGFEKGTANKPFDSVARYWEMIREIDDKCREMNFTDWELNFTADMMNLVLTKDAPTSGQVRQIIRLHEKYCD